MQEEHIIGEDDDTDEDSTGADQLEPATFGKSKIALQQAGQDELDIMLYQEHKSAQKWLSVCSCSADHIPDGECEDLEWLPDT